MVRDGIMTIKICTPSCRRNKSIVWLLCNDQDV